MNTDEIKRKTVSLKDIARELNVSMTSVSRALHDSPEVSQELTAKVKALAAKYHYHPNPFAQSLRKGKLKVIGVVIPSMDSHFYSTVVAGLEEAATKNDYMVICTNSHEQSEIESKCLDRLVALHVDGIVACLAQDTTDYSKFEQLLNMGMPVVLFTRTCLYDKISSVVSDDTTASHSATLHLIEQGCRRIGFIGGPNHLDMVKRRKRGFISALHESHLPLEPVLFKCGPLDRQTVINSAKKLILEEHVDSLFAINYDSSFGAIDAIRETKRRMPDDVALIGFVDNNDIRYLTPPISVIVDNSYEIGKRCCHLLLKRIGGESKIHHEVIPMEINFRESTIRKR